MKKSLMVIACGLCTIFAIIWGTHDNNNMTAAAFFALLLVAIIFDKEDKRNVKE